MTSPAGYPVLADALADAEAFVHVGRDDDLRYLAGLAVDSEAAFVHADGRAVLCASPADDAGAFPGVVRADDADRPAGRRAVAVLDEFGADGVVLTPRHVPHDAALYLQGAGYTLESTAAVAEARTVKTAPELDRLEHVGRAASAAMRRVAAVLEGAAVVGDELRRDGDPLSPSDLRRAAAVALAERGVDVGATAVAPGSDALGPGVPIVVSLAPRGPDGYRVRLARTFVVEGEGGWERRAHVATESARRVAVEEIAPGATARDVHEEALAELAAYGFGEAGRPLVSGVGLALRERPSHRSDVPLKPGTVVAIEPGVAANGTAVRLVDSYVVTENGPEPLAPFPASMMPTIGSD